MSAEAAELATPEQDPEGRDEIERLDPQPLTMELESGLKFDLNPLKLREFLSLLRILTRGGGQFIASGALNFEDDEFAGQLIGMLLFAIPEAEDEAVDFIRSITKPAGIPNRSFDEKNKDDIPWIEALQRFDAELSNPSLEDTITIIEALVHREAGDIRALGKRLQMMFETAQKLGAIPS